MPHQPKCTIFDIKKYAIHDGPGIRTTLFFKGCPLSCIWCHNPESISAAPCRVYDRQRCIGCRECVEICPGNALIMTAGGMGRDEKLCRECGECVRICPAKAQEQAGRECGVEELIGAIERDLPFYESSGGGVTFSGGEPLMQPDALLILLKECKKLDIHTAVDTTGFASWNIVREIAAYTDIFLFDLKVMDDEKHRMFTGVSNERILSNLQQLAALNVDITIRIPLIPEINDDDLNLKASGSFIAGLAGVNEVSLLPFHDLQQSKYEKFAIPYRAGHLQVPTEEEIENAGEKLRKFGLKVTIG